MCRRIRTIWDMSTSVQLEPDDSAFPFPFFSTLVHCSNSSRRRWFSLCASSSSPSQEPFPAALPALRKRSVSTSRSSSSRAPPQESPPSYHLSAPSRSCSHQLQLFPRPEWVVRSTGTDARLLAMVSHTGKHRAGWAHLQKRPKPVGQLSPLFESGKNIRCI